MALIVHPGRAGREKVVVIGLDGVPFELLESLGRWGAYAKSGILVGRT